MQQTIKPDHAVIPQQLLGETLRLLAEARDFYARAGVRVADEDVHLAFSASAKIHDDLLRDLEHNVPSNPVAGSGYAPFISVESHFDPCSPERSGPALCTAERDLIHRLEHLFRLYPDMHMRGVLKQHIAGLQRAEAMMCRLALRAAA